MKINYLLKTIFLCCLLLIIKLIDKTIASEKITQISTEEPIGANHKNEENPNVPIAAETNAFVSKCRNSDRDKDGGFDSLQEKSSDVKHERAKRSARFADRRFERKFRPSPLLVGK